MEQWEDRKTSTGKGSEPEENASVTATGGSIVVLRKTMKTENPLTADDIFWVAG